MFTVKYIYPTGEESLTTGWDSISVEWVDTNGASVPVYEVGTGPRYQVVHACREPGEGTMTFGPNLPVLAAGTGVREAPAAFVYVMNESGATVAKYIL